MREINGVMRVVTVTERETNTTPNSSTSGLRGPIICHLTASCIVISHFLIALCSCWKKETTSEEVSVSSPSCLSLYKQINARTHNDFIYKLINSESHPEISILADKVKTFIFSMHDDMIKSKSHKTFELKDYNSFWT